MQVYFRYYYEIPTQKYDCRAFEFKRGHSILTNNSRTTPIVVPQVHLNGQPIYCRNAYHVITTSKIGEQYRKNGTNHSQYEEQM